MQEEQPRFSEQSFLQVQHQPDVLPRHFKSRGNQIKADWSFLENGQLFGRKEEIGALQQSFTKRFVSSAMGEASAEAPNRELILVSGESGSGKSVLVKKALQELVAEEDGYFLLGKFEQFQQCTSEPYVAFVAALTQLIVTLEQEFLTVGGDEQRGALKQLMLSELGFESCHVLCSLVPELVRLLRLEHHLLQGDQHDEALVEVQKTQQDRLNAAVAGFLRVVGTAQKEPRPIVLVIDDLQWADSLSLDLLEALVAPENGASTSSYMVVGICRREEVPVEHSFAAMLRRFEDEKETDIVHVQVANLSLAATNDLLSGALRQSPESCLTLACVIHEKSDGGNAFFMLQLLKLLLRESVLVPDKDGQWHWCDEKWDRVGVLDVVDLVSRQLHNLSRPCRHLLKVMACIGGEVDLNILLTAIGPENTKEDLLDMLRTAKEERLIVEQLPHQPDRFSFAHDRIQQAAYSLISAKDQPIFHLSIGRTLLQSISLEELEEHIFLVVNQLIRGISLLTTDVDKIGLAGLCLRAGNKSTRAGVLESARMYFEIGIKLLPSRHWRDEYDLSLELFTCKAQAECRLADFKSMDSTLDEILSNGRSLHDKIRAYQVKILGLGNRVRLKEALDLGLEVLASLGEKFPSKPRLIYLIPEFIDVKKRLQSKSDAEILSLPDIDPYNRENLAATFILNTLASYPYCGSPGLYPFLVLRGLKRSLKDGVRELSCQAFAAYGMMLCAAGDYKEGHRFGQLALKLSDRFPRAKGLMDPRTGAIIHGLIAPWRQPLQLTFDPLRNAIVGATNAGDHECAMYTSFILISHEIGAGDGLELVDQELNKYMPLMSNDSPWLALTLLKREFVDNLMGRTNDPLKLKIDQELYKQPEFKNYKCSAKTLLMQLGYHLGDSKLALSSANAMRCLMGKVSKPSIFIVMCYMYDGLVALEAARHDRLRRWHYMSLAKSLLAKLEKLATKICPDNVMDKFFLLQGEIYASNGQLEKALFMYTRAMNHAAAQGVSQVHALAHERAAIALRRLGDGVQDQAESARLMQRAIELYQTWGALAIVRHLKDRVARQNKLF